MEHLTKQQILLLGVFVSFVTSIATAVFTVSLMSQSPQGVVKTVNQVVERTIEKVVTDPGSKPVTVVLDVKEQLVTAVNNASSTVVAIYEAVKVPAQALPNNATSAQTWSIDTEPVGYGTLLTTDGYVLISSQTLRSYDADELVAVFAGNPATNRVEIEKVFEDRSGDLMFLKVKDIPSPIKKFFTPIDSKSKVQNILTPSPVLIGQTVFALKNPPNPSLTQGIIEGLRSDDGAIITSPQIAGAGSLEFASPLFNLKSEVVGFRSYNSYTSVPFILNILEKEIKTQK